MKLLSLELRQWRSFPSLELEFPDGLIGVRGANGAGKTTIAEAIGWALFGKLRPGAKVSDLKRQGAPSGERSSAALTFRLGPTVYRVERVVSGTAKLWIGDAAEPETSQTRATNQRIAQELDLTWETFQRTVFARQKDVAALAPEARGEDRKRHVERLLGLERFRLAAEKARSHGRELEQQLVGLREQAPDLEALRAEHAEAERAAADGSPEVENAKRAEAMAKDRLTEANTELERERLRAQQHHHLSSEVERLEGEINELDSDLMQKREQLSKRANQEAELASLDGRDRDVGELELRRRRWERLAECHEELERTRSGEVPDFDLEVAGAREIELAELDREYESTLRTVPPDLESLGRRVAALKMAAKAPSGAAAEERLQQLITRRDAAHGDLATLEARIAEDEQHLAAIEEGGAEVACPACLRPYGDEYESILTRHRERLEHQRAEREELRTEREALDGDKAAAEAALTSAREAEAALKGTSGPEDLDAAKQALADAERERSERTRRLTDLERLRDELQAQVKADDQSRKQTQDHRAALGAAQQRFKEASALLEVEAYDEAEKLAAVKSHEQAVAAAETRLRLTTALAATANVHDETDRLVERRDQRADRLTRVRTELTGMAFDVAKVAKLEQACKTAAEKLNEATTARTSAELAAASADDKVGELRARLEDAERQHAVISERALEAREYAVAGELLSEYRTAQHQRAWPKLEIGASSLLSETTDGRYADVRLSQDYKLVIVDRGQEHGLERYSGGEQDLANLCLRLAIADWVARERGAEMGFVVLDEVFGSQDDERRQRLLGQLRALGNRFHQLLVITHLADIAELCDHHLQVELVDEGHSAASFVG